ncbi:MAG: hypothetical protein NZ898_03645 [Myxococcota bacterium]|nr:hypothetical protein [Myxococcota bacterium]MDW8361202.1 hypothetical protein [Myxococcales bacterium]
MTHGSPRRYRSIEEFEREEIRVYQKCGFSLDDLFNEATFHAPEDNPFEERRDPDFDF